MWCLSLEVAPRSPEDCAPHGLEARTRDRVSRAISEHGPVTAAALGRHPRPDPRRRPPPPRRPGRRSAPSRSASPRARSAAAAVPPRAYVLSEAGHRALNSDYDDLATSALRFLADRAGDDAVAAFARERVARLEERYADALAAAGDDPAARADALAVALAADGFAASARPVGQGTPLAGVQLCQGHCPVQHVAAEFPQFCDAETEAFSRLLGVHVQRLATLAHGDHVCTTFIPTPAVPARSTTPPPTSDERASR